MAHNLRTDINGKASMAFSSTIGTPWHGLGTSVHGLMTAAECIQAASLDYEVTKEALFTQDGRKAPSYATMASDTRALLGVVGERYTPLQNRDAFEFCDALAQGGEAKFLTAGALGQGERVWIMMAPAKDATVEIVKGDPIESKLLFSNTHDGSTGVECRDTTITVVCQNTLNAAFGAAKPTMKIRHTASVAARVRLAAGIMAEHVEHHKSWVEAMRYLAKHPVTDAIVEAFEVEMFGDLNATPEGRGRTILTTKLDQFERLLVTGKGTEIPGRVGNLYGMLQAYTEWQDWESRVKGTTDRTNSIVFGAGAKRKTKALEYALVLAKGVK